MHGQQNIKKNRKFYLFKRSLFTQGFTNLLLEAYEGKCIPLQA